ncbi:MAG TPA: TonB-dependent receptor [Gammaproteobacteria bacterium]|nr:TonB-dependent receptor [Gammaproteobacteria bacterium]
MQHSLKSSKLGAIASLALVCAAAPAAIAQTTEAGANAFERLTVIGRRPAELAGGSASYLTTAELARFEHTDVHRVLRQVPGLYIVEEDGHGLRPNIGIRGSGTDRNSRITVMEDGVLIAPAPYAAPAAYYFPTMQRMSAVEVRKGSSSVRSGPRTTGGAVNLISAPIPDDSFTGRASLDAGEDQTLLGHVTIGGTSGRWGYLVDALRQETEGFKRIDGGGDSGYALDDVLAKLRYTTPSGARFYQELELKLGVTDQDGDETYMGLTREDFERDPYRRYAASRLDNIQTDHDQAELRHYVSFNDRLDLTTALYNNEFARNWYKVDRLATASMSAVLEDPATFATEYAWLTGATSPDDAIVIRNNNRAYQSRGVQTILGLRLAGTGNVEHDLEFGIRYHEDEEDRLQDDDRYRMDGGQLVLTTDGAPGTQDNRVGMAEAVSIYVHDEIGFGRFIVTPGVRYEGIDLEQRRWAGSNPGRVAGPTSLVRSEVDELIAGVGASYRMAERWTLLGGIHQGFNPPGPGGNAESEESLNYEMGARYVHQSAGAELIAFYNDYDNLVGTCTASTGGGCNVGDQFSGGKVRMHGLELSGRYEFDLRRGLRLPVQLTYTYTSAEFGTSFSSGFDEWGDVQAGDELPYLPEQQAQLLAGLAAERWGVNLAASYTDSMRVEAGQAATPPNGATDSHWVVDLAGNWTFTDKLGFFARVENVLDEVYVVAWRPAGARPGRPRTGLVGVRMAF